MTFDFPDNDLRMSRYVTDRAAEIAPRDGRASDQPSAPRTGPTRSCRTRRRTTPAARSWAPTRATSVVNRYLQSWDVPNVFVIGAATVPQNASYNPTDTVGALAYWAADAIAAST